MSGNIPDFMHKDPIRQAVSSNRHLLGKLVPREEELVYLESQLFFALLIELRLTGLTRIPNIAAFLRSETEDLDLRRGKSPVEVAFDRLPNYYYLTEISQEVNKLVLQAWVENSASFFRSLIWQDTGKREDVSQEVYLKLLAKLRKEELYHVMNLKSYIQGSARRIAVPDPKKINQFNGKSMDDPQTRLDLTDDARAVGSMNQKCDLDELRKKITARLNKVTPEQINAVLELKLEEYTDTEIAAELDLPVLMVRSIWSKIRYRAKAKVRRAKPKIKKEK